MLPSSSPALLNILAGALNLVIITHAPVPGYIVGKMTPRCAAAIIADVLVGFLLVLL